MPLIISVSYRGALIQSRTGHGPLNWRCATGSRPSGRSCAREPSAVTLAHCITTGSPSRVRLVKSPPITWAEVLRYAFPIQPVPASFFGR